MLSCWEWRSFLLPLSAREIAPLIILNCTWLLLNLRKWELPCDTSIRFADPSQHFALFSGPGESPSLLTYNSRMNEWKKKPFWDGVGLGSGYSLSIISWWSYGCSLLVETSSLNNNNNRMISYIHRELSTLWNLSHALSHMILCIPLMWILAWIYTIPSLP